MPTSVPEPRWELPDNPSLAWLKKRAKELVARAADGDDAALELVGTYDPGAGPVPLARAQRVLARAFGFAGPGCATTSGGSSSMRARCRPRATTIRRPTRSCGRRA